MKNQKQVMETIENVEDTELSEYEIN